MAPPGSNCQDLRLGGSAGRHLALLTMVIFQSLKQAKEEHGLLAASLLYKMKASAK